MLWVIDAELKDNYNLCYGSESFWENGQNTSDWSVVADKLIQRLNEFRSARDDDNFLKDYQRDRLSDRIIQALENASRHEGIIPICEQEAVKTGSYPRLVDALRRAKRYQEAEQSWLGLEYFFDSCYRELFQNLITLFAFVTHPGAIALLF